MGKKLIISIVIVISIALLVAIGLAAGNRNKNRGFVGRMKRWCNGESYFEQNANDLAYDLRYKHAWSSIQPWALDAMARFQAGKLKGRDENHFYWANDAFLLAPEEIPAFIKDQLGMTNKLGDVQPDVSIVMANGNPDYVILDWGIVYGIVVGPTNYEFSFAVSGTNKVAPGIYTFYVN
jgi:hypothetical protein